MKKILTLLLTALIATAVPCFATTTYNDYLNYTGGSLSGSDVLIFERADRTANYSITATAMQTWFLRGINSTALTDLGNTVDGSGGILTFAGLGSVTEGYDATIMKTGAYNSTTVSALGHAPDGASGLLSFGGLGSVTQAYNTNLAAIAAGTWTGATSLTTLGTITTGTWTGTTIALANGGTGATTQAGAQTALGLVIGTNVEAWNSTLDALAAGSPLTAGTNITISGSWPNLTIAASSGVTGITAGTGLTGGTISSTGTIAIDTSVVATLTGTQTLTNKSISAAQINSGTLTVAQGGTNATTASAARTSLGVAIGTNVEAWHATLDTIGALTLSGTAGSTTFLRGDGAWTALPTGSWVYVAGDVTTVAGEKIAMDPFSGSHTITLPASPNDGDVVEILDFTGNDVSGTHPGFGTRNMTVSGNGTLINLKVANTTASTVTLAHDNEDAVFIYLSGESGWVYRETWQHSLSGASTPGNSAGTGAGTSPTIALTGTDVSGVISVTPGTSPATSATILTVGYYSTYSPAPAAVTLSPANAAAAALTGASQVFVSASNAATFVVTSGSTALTASTLYKWTYTVSQQ